jgi:hypothetical protein
MKTTHNITKIETRKKASDKGIYLLHIDGKLTNNYQTIANCFNTYFLTIPDKISSKNTNANNAKLHTNNSLHYLIQAFEHPFPNIKFSYV